MTFNRAWGATAFFATALVAVVACSGSTSSSNSSNGQNNANFKPLCMSSCPKSCNADSDCAGQGELCCDFGSGAKACVEPQACPRYCNQDSDCHTDQGESCYAANPGSTQKVCAPTNARQTSCSTDNDCSGATPKCCTDLAQPVCTPTAECPTQCRQSSDCNTSAGLSCCTSIAGLLAPPGQPHLAGNVAGLCLSPTECPKACTQDSQCDTANNQLCCDGFCSDASACQKSCSSDNDCPTDKGELCCTNPAIGSPWWGWQTPSGSSSGGSGSSSGSSSGGGNCVVGAPTGIAACDQCVGQYCCSQDDACAQNGQCVSLLSCLRGCAGNSSCVQTCEQQYPSGLSTLQTLASCMQQDCPSQCGASSSGGSSSGGSSGSSSGGNGTGGPCNFASDCAGGNVCCAQTSAQCNANDQAFCVTAASCSQAGYVSCP